MEMLRYRKFYKTQNMTLPSERSGEISSYKLTNQPKKAATTTKNSCLALPYYIDNEWEQLPGTGYRQPNARQEAMQDESGRAGRAGKVGVASHLVWSFVTSSKENAFCLLREW